MHNGLDKRALHLIIELFNMKIAFYYWFSFYPLADLCETLWSLESTLYIFLFSFLFIYCISKMENKKIVSPKNL